MARRLCTLLLFFAAGCAGGDLMRADSEGGALGQSSGDETTGGSEPLTTGLTGLSEGDPQTTEGPEATTGSQPGSDAESDGEASSAGGEDDATSSTGVDPSMGDDESSSSTTGGEAPEGEVDLSGWTLIQTDSSRTFTLPEGTVVPAGGVLIVGRNASRGQFEQYWGPLADGVIYLDAADEFPAINGNETFTLRDDSNAVADGPTPALQSAEALQRADLSDAGTWTAVGEGDADPGTGHPNPGAPGVFLTEVSDASGSGNYVFEYVELQAWPL